MTVKSRVEEPEKTRAEQLCHESNLDFGSVFCQQFRITDRKLGRLPGFRLNAVGKWYVEVGRETPVAVSEAQDGSKLVLLGIAVSPDGKIVNEQQLAELADAAKAIDWLNECAGRFAFLIVSDTFSRFYQDPLGTLGAVYNRQEGVVSTTLNLGITRSIITNEAYPLTELATQAKARFAFGHTPDAHVKRILPNHYLDLNEFQLCRFWPGADSLVDAELNDDEALLRFIATRLSQIVGALANQFDGTKLPLSGGLDSRVLLACAKPFLDRIELFSHAESMMSRRDTRIARELASATGQRISIYDPLRDDKHQIGGEAKLSALSDAYHIAVGGDLSGRALPKVRLEVLEALPKGGLVLRGNGVDFLKAVLWRRGIAEFKNSSSHNPWTGLKMMMLTDRETMRSLPQAASRSLIDSYRKWYADLVGVARERPFDLMFAEQFLPHGTGNFFYGFSRNFYMCPFNDRKLLAAAMSLSPWRRSQFHYTESIIATMAPELRAIRYTRKAVTELLSAKADDDPQWFTR